MFELTSLYHIAAAFLLIVYVAYSTFVYDAMTVDSLVRREFPRVGYAPLPRWWRVLAALLSPLGLLSPAIENWLWRMPPEDSPWR